MKSSVFTREDPFPPPPTQKTWYHPSRRQNLTQKKSSKKTAGPGCTSRPDNPQSTAEERQKRGPNRKPGPPQTPPEDHLSFPESWPSTDLDPPPTDETFSPNIVATPGLSESARVFNTSSPHQEDSVLAKYVERFRYGEPRSRAERRPVSSAGGEEARPFWWMAPSSLPSRPEPAPRGHADDAVPLKEDRVPGSPVDRREDLGTPGTYREPLDVSTWESSDCSLEDHWDPEGVQDRASRLLHKSESTVSSSSLVVSSEGLGGSELSPVSVTEPVLRPSSSRRMESSVYNPSSTSPPVGIPSQKNDMFTSWGSGQRPEEDILFQWRLRRKMEQARHCPPPLSQAFPSLHQPPSAWQNPSLPQPPSACQNPSLHQPPSACQSPSLHQPPSACQSPSLHQPPSAWQNPSLHQPASAWQGPGLHQAAVSGGVDHKLLIGPPLPLQQQRTNQDPGPPQGTAPFALLGSQRGGVEVRGLDARCPPPSQPASTPPAVEPCLWEGSPGPAPSAPPPALPDAPTKPSQPILRTVGERESRPAAASSECRREESSSETKRSESEKMADRKMKRCRRPAGDGPGPPAAAGAGGSRPRPVRMVASTPQRSSKSKDEWSPPAPSPVQQALRQAVSEVLFPPRGCSSSSSVTRRRAPPATRRPPGPPGVGASPQSPAEVVSQLLQEAEDSDGEEFEDDSLLRVLRKQRTWVKDQISQVDSLLEEFLQEGEIT